MFMNVSHITNDKAFDLPAANLLVAEFNYIANTAFQANEERARVSQLFFVTFGTFVAALFSSQLSDVDINQIYKAFTILFVLIAVFGGMTMLQLARLRLAWIDSARAMNQIKNVAIDYNPEIASFFRWNRDNLPPAYKPRSVGFILAVMVALLSGLAIGSAVSFFSLSNEPNSVPWFLSIFIGSIGAIILFAACYWQPLK
jgi:FtsH-binding integral membrane protein